MNTSDSTVMFGGIAILAVAVALVIFTRNTTPETIDIKKIGYTTAGEPTLPGGGVLVPELSHNGATNLIDILDLQDGTSLVVTAGLDKKVKLAKFKDGSVVDQHVAETGGIVPTALKISKIGIFVADASGRVYRIK